MHKISFAPVLSATLSRDSCWITSTPYVSPVLVAEPGGTSVSWCPATGGTARAAPALAYRDPIGTVSRTGPGTCRLSRLLLVLRVLRLFRLLEDLHDAPPLGRRQRPGLHQQHAVTDPTGVGLVVRLVLLR